MGVLLPMWSDEPATAPLDLLPYPTDDELPRIRSIDELIAEEREQMDWLRAMRPQDWLFLAACAFVALAWLVMCACVIWHFVREGL